MSKEKDTQQMSLLVDSHVNHSALQEKENQQQMIVTSGMKCLESLEKSNQDGLLAKMLKALLISTKAWYSDRCLMTWKTKVSKANVLLFQLQASVLGIKENESGLYPTPRAQEPGRTKEGYGRGLAELMEGKKQIKMYPTPTQDSASERTKKYKQGGTPLTMAVKMFPTPTAGCIEGGEQSSRVEMTESGGFILRKKNKPQMTFGAKLSDAMLYLEKKEQTKLGGKLNPNFVEFLMGYPTNWTKVE